MRLTAGVLTIALFAAPLRLSAQVWQASAGLQGGFTYTQAAGQGSNAFSTALTLPGIAEGPSAPSPSTLYFIVPIGGRFALEPSGTVGVESSGAFENATMQVGLRADYLLTEGLYAAGGAIVAWGNARGARAPGYVGTVQLAVGWRFPLTGTLDARLEATSLAWSAKKNAFSAIDTYSLMFGVSAPFTARRSARPMKDDRALWQTSLGTAAGFALIHLPGQKYDYATFMAPSWGANGDFPYTFPSLYLTIPVGGRIAVEPGVNIVRVHLPGYTTFGGELSVHANYAFTDHWYGGLAADVDAITYTGKKLAALSGVGVQGGYRFHLSGSWGGRIELSHLAEAKHRVLQELPFTSTALAVGVSVAVR